MAERYCRVGRDKEALKDDGGSVEPRHVLLKGGKKKKPLAPVQAEMK